MADPRQMLNKFGDGLYRAAASSHHNNPLEAIAADALDLIPLVGDGFNAARIADARGDKRRTITQSIDFAVGLIPVVGDIADIFLPVNTLNYFADRLPDPMDMLKRLPIPGRR